MTVVDSDILIRVLRGRKDTAAQLREAASRDVLACSVITTFEVLRGCTLQQLAQTESLLGALVQLPVTEAISRRAAEHFRSLRGQNVNLATHDLLIGCTALEHDAVLLTGNARHFPLPGLVLG